MMSYIRNECIWLEIWVLFPLLRNQRVTAVQVGGAEPALLDDQPSRTCKTLPFL